MRIIKEKEGGGFKLKTLSSGGGMLVWSVLSKKSLNSLSKKLDQGRRVNVSVSHSVTVQMILGAKQLIKLKQKYNHEDSDLCLTISLSNEEIGNK